MYLSTIVLIVILAIAGAYGVRTFPLALVVAVVSCVIIEMAIVKVTGQKPRVPLVAIITGLIIGSVAPIDASFFLIIAACLIAETTKFFLKAKGRNIFNPAAIGLLVALVAFGAGDEWWAAVSVHAHGLLIPLAAILIIAAYEGRRWIAGLSAAGVGAVGIIILSGTGLSGAGVVASILSVNYFFAFLMVADPKTSPNAPAGQILYGVGIAAISALLLFAHVPYSLLISLIVANIVYALFRVFYKSESHKTAL